MTAWRAVGWFWLVAGLGIVAFLLSGPPWAPRPVAPAQGVSIARGMDPGRPPTPRGRCWLAPSRVRRLDQTDTIDSMNETCNSRLGCVVDNIGAVWALEEPIVVECVADGHGRRTR